VFERKDADIHLALPLTLVEAVRGAKITVPTLYGPVAMTIPRHSSTGAVLRLKGKGLPRAGGTGSGDQYVRLEIALPRAADAALEEAITAWERQHPYDPRADLMREARA
jgi:DnaJ-class molecular chaperone